MSRSSIELLARYRKERLPLGVFVPAALFLGLAATVPFGGTGLPGALGASGLAFVLVAMLRLADDLADRRWDMQAHPERVVPSARSRAPFVTVLVVLAACGPVLMALYATPRAAAGLVALEIGCGVWYGALRGKVASARLRAHFTLLKYPFLVWLLMRTPSMTGSAWTWLGIVYLCFTTFELIHDEALRARPGAAALLWSELGLLAVASLVSIRMEGTAAPGWLSPAIVVLLLLAGIRTLPVREGRAGWRYAGFAAGLLNLVAIRL